MTQIKYKIQITALMMLITGALCAQPSGKEILDKIDANMSSDTRYVKSKMVIHGPRSSRTVESESWTEGTDSFTEYLAPAREKGTKMLKLEDKLWIFSPSTDRTIQISGHMLRQSVMGSDLSYEDMMDDRKLSDVYDAGVIGSETIGETECWIVEMRAIDEEVAYQMRKLWVDQSRYIPLKEELYAKSGKLLKKTELSNITKHGSRWYPEKITFKDMLKKGAGTEFIVDEIIFDVEIPEHVLSKASLR